jgi:hypothetical protein
MAEPKNGTAAAPATKMEAVERTLAELGRGTLPMAIKAHLKKRYGIEISAAVASDYKKKLKKKAKAAAKPEAPKPAAVPSVAQAASPVKKAAAPAKQPAPRAKKAAVPKPRAASPQPPKKANGTNGGSVLLEDVLTAKTLLDRVGPDKLRTLIEGLAK